MLDHPQTHGLMHAEPILRVVRQIAFALAPEHLVDVPVEVELKAVLTGFVDELARLDRTVDQTETTDFLRLAVEHADQGHRLGFGFVAIALTLLAREADHDLAELDAFPFGGVHRLELRQTGSRRAQRQSQR